VRSRAHDRLHVLESHATPSEDLERVLINVQPRSQKVIVWWSLAFFAIYALLGLNRFLLPAIPPLAPDLPAAEVAQWYAEHSTRVKIGAFIASWVAAAWAPFLVVMALQMYRHEKAMRKLPVWTAITGACGVMVSIFLVLPPIFWGVAAFTPTRAPEITALMNELAYLSFVTTDQYFIFAWVGITVVCLIPNSVVHTPFKRWYGYFNAFMTVIFEFGAFAFLAKSGPFAWNGLFPYWLPLFAAFAWFGVTTFVLLQAINQQVAEQDAEAAQLANIAP
jgi:hypothetical protein